MSIEITCHHHKVKFNVREMNRKWSTCIYYIYNIYQVYSVSVCLCVFEFEREREREREKIVRLSMKK